MPFGHAGYLQVAYVAGGKVAAQVGGEVAFDDLAVVEVHLHFEVDRADVGEHAVATHGPSSLMNEAPSQYGSRAASAGRPPTVGANQGVRPCAMFTM